MTEEKVGQIIRCVKECWWRVGFLLLLAIGLALLVMYGWPFKVHVDVKLLNWVQTVAACIAGFGAIYTAYIALSVARQEREERRQSALKYLLVEMSTFASFREVTERLLDTRFGGLTEKGFQEIKDVLNNLRGLNRERIIDASTAFGDVLLITENRISALIQSIEQTSNSTFMYVYSPGIAKEIKVNAKAMNKAVSELFYKNENWESFLDIRNYE